MAGVVVQCPPDDQGYAATRPQHTRHLLEGGEAVGKELHALLADDDVECRRGAGEGGRTALHPRSCRGLQAGNR
jgi:hypothetical protein